MHSVNSGCILFINKTMKIINPKKYNLHSRTILQEIEPNHIAIIKKIKSRIIMKDGRKIMDQINQIKSFNNKLKVSLIISGPICSKTKAFLEKQGIEIFSL